MRKLTPYIAYAICLLNATVAIAEDPSLEGWTYLRDKKNIQVYRREVPNSDVIAVRGITTVPYPVEEVYAVMADNIRSPEWVPMVSKKETIRVENDKSRIEYARIKMPWPLRDRYTVARGALQIGPDQVYSIKYESVDGEFEDPGRVRARLDLSTFYLRPTSKNETYIDITLLSDPMGMVPKFLVNAFQKNWPVQFLDGLSAQISKVRAERLEPPTIQESMPLAH